MAAPDESVDAKARIPYPKDTTKDSESRDIKEGLSKEPGGGESKDVTKETGTKDESKDQAGGESKDVTKDTVETKETGKKDPWADDNKETQDGKKSKKRKKGRKAEEGGEAPPPLAEEAPPVGGEEEGALGGVETPVPVTSDGLPPDNAKPDVITEPPVHLSTGNQVLIMLILCYLHAMYSMQSESVAVTKDFVADEYGETGWMGAVRMVPYLVGALVGGYLGDRFSRKWILVGGLVIWILMVELTGWTPKGHNFMPMLLAGRGLAGIGEASFLAVSTAVIADTFIGTKRSTMLAIFFMMIPVGLGLAGTAGLFLAKAGGWRLVGKVLPGLGAPPFVLLIVLFKDPPRGYSQKLVGVKAGSFGEDVAFLFQTTSYVWSLLGWTMSWFTLAVFQFYVPDFMALGYDKIYDPSYEDNMYYNMTKWIAFSQGKSGTTFGYIIAGGGLAGIAAGVYSSVFWRRSNPRAYPLVCVFSKLLATPILVLGLSLYQFSELGFYANQFVSMTLIFASVSVTNDILMSILPPARRAVGKGLSLFICHLFGDCFSTLIMAAILKYKCSEPFKCDYTKREGRAERFEATRQALYIPSLAPLVGALAYFLVMVNLVRDTRRADLAARASAQGLVESKKDT